MRRRRRVEETLMTPPDMARTGPTLTFEDRDVVARALGELPRKQRAVLVLRFFEDLSVERVAQLLGCSTGTVKSQTSKALTKLRNSSLLDSEEHAHE